MLAAVAGTLFWLSFKHLDAEEDALNELDTGEFHSVEPDHEKEKP